MIYGDDPLKLNGYTYVPSIRAIMQSGSLYVYCMNNPLRWFDPSGKAVTEWDIAVMGGIPGRIERMQWITDNWASGTKKQQDKWRAEVEGYRKVWRNTYEYTDSSGITRSTATNGEIRFYTSLNNLGTAKYRILVGCSFDVNDKLVLASTRRSAYFIETGTIGVRLCRHEKCDIIEENAGGFPNEAHTQAT